MKKFLVIIIAVQFVLLVILVGFSMKQRSDAELARDELLELEQTAQKTIDAARAEAEMQRKAAVQSAMEAQRQADIARKAAAKCK